MATLALAAAGAAAGSALLPTGLSVLGTTLSGAAIGSQIGAIAGSYIDQSLFAPSGQSRTVEGPRLSDLHVTASTEGSPIPKVYGRVRLGGQVIWAADIEERVSSSTQGSGGSAKGGGTSGAGTSVTTVEYRYFASFAVAIAEGVITGLGRVWADGTEINLATINHRLYTGSEAQEPDALIEAALGAGNAPAFRGVAYVVFESLALRRFGNRIPQLSFEVYRSVEPFTANVKGVVVIPGSGEFVYATEAVTQDLGLGYTSSENVHTRQGATDWSVSIDQLEAALPNAKSASLVVSWFGTDLRAGECQIRPGVEQTAKATTPLSWSVAGVGRSGAHVVSQRDGRPAYGGTPSDSTVVAAIADLKARGFSVTLTPFILMDVPEDNTLPDPYSASGSQAAYPWRGRITVHPAAGVAGSPDKTAAAATQVGAFLGAAQASDFAVSGTSITYSGPAEWSFRRLVLHYAHLAVAAGGVDAFVIGTELRGLTFVRSAASTYPFVDALIALAAELKGVLGPSTKILYAADWSEYFGHQPGDGTGDVYFHLDPLWSSPSIDAIGIDQYWPLSDWRDGTAHLDYLAGVRSIHDLAYLRSNVQGGEGYDWYYASQADRDAQVRSPVTDGGGKPWVFRYKDLKSWWLNAHYDRPDGVESATPTAWIPQSKPFWLMEIGCPAVDKGANQPNVFVDPKSAESALPYFSRGTRNDLMQRRYLRALIEAFDPASTGYVDGLNPVSAVYGGRMVDPDRIHVYAWDARPFPAFPFMTDVWGDGENWRLGHWLNGRFASAPLSEAVGQMLTDFGFTDFDTGALNGIVAGYAIDRVMSARDAIQPLELAYFFDSLETGGKIVFRQRGAEAPAADLVEDDLVEPRAGDALLKLTRSQETDLPASAKINYVSSEGDYRQAVAEARRIAGASGRVAQADLPIVIEPEQAGQIAESWLYEAWAARERASLKLPPTRLGVEPGDVLSITNGGEARLFRVTEASDHGAREIEARAIDPEVYSGIVVPSREIPAGPPVLSGQALVEFLDLPLLKGDEPPAAGYVAATQTPWPGGIAIYSSPEASGFVLRTVASAPTIMGTTVSELSSGPCGVLDRAARLQVGVGGGTLESVSELQLLAGRNAAAIRNADGEWEVFQFQSATLISAGTYELSGLLRGQSGTEFAMRDAVAAGAPFVLIADTLAVAGLGLNEVRLPLNWRTGPASRDIGDATYVTRQHTFTGAGLRPLAPVHVRGSRSSGDLEVAWIRRTRVGGDSWDSSEVPLAEDSEHYEVDILDGSIIRRTLAVNAPVVTYTAAQQIADFGAPQSTVSVRVYQLSAFWGRGTPALALV